MSSVVKKNINSKKACESYTKAAVLRTMLKTRNFVLAPRASTGPVTHLLTSVVQNADLNVVYTSFTGIQIGLEYRVPVG